MLTLNLVAQQAMVAAFDPLLRRSFGAGLVGITSRGGSGAFRASQAALETLLLSYGAEVANVSKIKVALVDAEGHAEKAAEAMLEMVRAGFETGHRLVV